MKKLGFIGDVHGKVSLYMAVRSCYEHTIQVGDMGLGFRDIVVPTSGSDKHKFIHGNHDNPDECAKHPGFLGRFGLCDFAGYRILFISGALSIDKHHRTVGVDWWSTDEELGRREANELLDLLCIQNRLKTEREIDIVVSHDCPLSIRQFFMSHHTPIHSDTAYLLDRVRDLITPKWWIFGHHHISFRQMIDDTTFVCLSELEHFSPTE